MIESDITNVFDAQIDFQGVGAIKVSDGEVFMFPVEMLRKLIEVAEAKQSDKVVVFIKRSNPA